MAMILLFLRVAMARLRKTPVTIEMFGGRRMHLLPDGRLLPVIAGASGEGEGKGEGESGEGGDGSGAGKSGEGEGSEGEGEPLGESGKAALEAERKARKKAEKEAREAAARAKKLEDEKLSEEDQLKKRAEEGDKKAQAATVKLQNANLLTELTNSEEQLVDPKAAARLITGVEYDDQDEPTNLEERVTALLEEYPFLKADRKRRDATDPANPPAPRPKPGNQDDDATLNAWMSRAFGIGKGTK